MGCLAWCSPFNESFLLQRFAVNLKDANETTNEIPIFLIGNSPSAGEPGKLARRFRMIGIISDIALDSAARRERFSFVDQNRVIDPETRVSGKKTNEQLAARQSSIQIRVRFILVLGVMLKNHPEVAESKINRPTKTDVFL